MAYQLEFETLVEYDAGIPGVSLDVELCLVDASVQVLAKVDTGSDRCIFSRESDEKLGIDIETGEFQSFNTAAGSFKTFGHPVTLIAAGFSFDVPAYFSVDDGFTHNVLGRFGWLDRVIVGINDYDGKLYLSRHYST
jgi:hypothetical protein